MGNGEPIRILRVIARLNIGGPAIQAVRLSARFSPPGYETLLVCGNVGPGEGDMSYLAHSEGVTPKILGGLGREISPADDLRSLQGLRKIIKTFRPHIIHTHTAKAGTLGRLAGMLTKGGPLGRARLVHTFHGHVFEGYFGRGKAFVFLQIERFLARFTDRIVVISPLQFADICGKYRIAPPHKVRVIPLGFELERFSEAGRVASQGRKELLGSQAEGSFVVGIVGRLTRIKNHHMFLDAAKMLKERGGGTRFRFLVVGDGELREELEKTSRELGIGEAVVFAGWQKDMVKAYGAMDVAALTSMNEGTPVTLIEAMASGVPVISTSVGGVPDVVGRVSSPGSGFQTAPRGVLVRPGEPADLAEGILFLLKNKSASEKMTERARQHVLREYAAERLTEEIASLYSDVLQQAGFRDSRSRGSGGMSQQARE